MPDVKNKIVVQVATSILCSKDVRAWLKAQASKTDTPIDDFMVNLLYSVLGCPLEE